LDSYPEKALEFLSSYSGVIITMNGFIFGLLGGFLVCSSSVFSNFYFFLGFETLAVSLISSIIAYPYLARSFFSDLGRILKTDTEKIEKKRRNVRTNKAMIKSYGRMVSFATLTLILGLVIVVTSLAQP
jgi:hypothetical protein